MKVRFWGVRGSVPTPITPQQIQAKITAVVQRMSEKDVLTPDAKERFVSSLPSWLFGTTGGNSPCVELEGSDGTKVLLDAGTGLRSYGIYGKKPKNNHYHIFISHFHWDHIQGIPFFDAIYDQKVKVSFYSGEEKAKEYLSGQQFSPYFPVRFESFTKNINFSTLLPSEVYNAGGFSVRTLKMNHPGGSYAYSFCQDEKKLVYMTDVELSQDDFRTSSEYEVMFRNADCVIIDSQYTEEEARQKAHWGHSGFCYSVDFAVHWGIKKMYLFHHDPLSDDKKLNAMLQSARWYAKYVCHSEIQIFLAMESQEFAI